MINADITSHIEFIETILIRMIIQQLPISFEEEKIAILRDPVKIEPLFEKVKPVFQYYRNLLEKNQIPNNTTEEETAIYPSQSFQNFVDKTFNTKKQSGFEYHRLITAMKQEEFRKKVEKAWYREEEERKCKNGLIHKIQEMITNHREQEYVDIRSYLEYLLMTQNTTTETNDEIKEKAIREISDFLCIYNI